VGKKVGVSVGGNQTTVVVDVCVSGMGVVVGGGAVERPLHADRKTSMSIPRNKKVSFIGKISEVILCKLLYNQCYRQSINAFILLLFEIFRDLRVFKTQDP
jgi:hypothetical protein